MMLCRGPDLKPASESTVALISPIGLAVAAAALPAVLPSPSSSASCPSSDECAEGERGGCECVSDDWSAGDGAEAMCSADSIVCRRVAISYSLRASKGTVRTCRGERRRREVGERTWQ